MASKPITVKELGLTEKQMEVFIKGARIAYGNIASVKPPRVIPFTTPKPRK